MNKRLTVLFPITDLARDGAQRQLLEIVKGLDKNKFHPVVLTLNSGGAMEDDFRKISGLDIVSVEKKGKYDLFCLVRTFNFLRRLKVDIVQPFLTPATFFSLIPAIWHGTKVIIVTERNAGGRKDTGWGFRLYLKMEDIFSRFADLAVPNSEAGKNSLIQRGISPHRIKVIYNGLNLTRLNTEQDKVRQIKAQYNIPPHSPVVGMMARFFEMKNHPAFFEAARMIVQAVPSAHFALIGDGPLRPSMEKLAANMGLTNKVTFFGEQKDVGTYLSVFDIAVLTSHAEGCSNSLLEASALGKPAVATDVGGNREVIISGFNGFLVRAGDLSGLVDKVIYLLNNPEQARLMGQKSRELVLAKFSLSKMVQEYEALYDTTWRRKNER